MYTKAKHSPGPFTTTTGYYPLIQDATGRYVAKTDCSLNSESNWVKDRETARANADLLAAAPNLAAAASAARDLLSEMLRTATSNEQADAIDEVSSALTAALGKAGLLS